MNSTLPLALVFGVIMTNPAAYSTTVITAARETAEARPGEVIVVPFGDILRFMPEARMFHFVVRNMATGEIIPSQATNFEHDHGGVSYDDLVFQHDFVAGEVRASFAIEPTESPVAPYPTRVFARFVPERYDDFAWENDRIAHRMYGPALDSPAAGKSRLKSSGIDVWATRVTYPIVDRWYLKGHDQFHVDDGEGMDLYSVGPSRGCGGTGIWDGKKLHTSGNFAGWRVLANGPIRAVFELTYGPWQAGDLRVTETKRFTVDAGRNLDLIESTFMIEGGDGSATVALGIAKPIKATLNGITRGADGASLSVWATHGENGNLGCGVILLPDMKPFGFAEDEMNFLLLTPVRSGESVRYLAGAGWDRSGQFATRGAWDRHVVEFVERTRNPITITMSRSGE